MKKLDIEKLNKYVNDNIDTYSKQKIFGPPKS